jgi:hypothetical protein
MSIGRIGWRKGVVRAIPLGQGNLFDLLWLKRNLKSKQRLKCWLRFCREVRTADEWSPWAGGAPDGSPVKTEDASIAGRLE